jgi:hypothetical protein
MGLPVESVLPSSDAPPERPKEVGSVSLELGPEIPLAEGASSAEADVLDELIFATSLGSRSVPSIPFPPEPRVLLLTIVLRETTFPDEEDASADVSVCPLPDFGAILTPL